MLEKLKDQLGLKIILLILSLCLVGFGASNLVFSGIGGDAVVVFEQGVSLFLNIEFGVTIIVINIVFTILLFFINKKMINIGTIAFIVLVGPVVSLFERFPIFAEPQIFIAQLGIFLVGALFATFGISLYLYIDVGYTAFEGILLHIEDKTNVKFATIKIITDALLFVIGILLGGTFGWGSAISVFLFGPLIDLFVGLIKKTNIIKKTAIKTVE